jgi:hypothetical protein
MAFGMVCSEGQQIPVSNEHPPARMAMGNHLDDPGGNINQVPLYGPGSGGATILPTANTTSALRLGPANFGSTELASLSNPYFEELSPIVDASPAEGLEVTRSGTTDTIFGGFEQLWLRSSYDSCGRGTETGLLYSPGVGARIHLRTPLSSLLPFFPLLRTKPRWIIPFLLPFLILHLCSPRNAVQAAVSFSHRILPRLALSSRQRQST